MSDELKTIKFQLMLSPSEAAAIDDWGFKNRIRTRAEAIRRLCQIGLQAEDGAKIIREVAETGMMWASKTRKFQNEELGELAPQEDKNAAAPASHQTNLFTTMALTGVIALARDMEDRAKNLRSFDTFEEAIEKGLAKNPDLKAAADLMEDFLTDFWERFPELKQGKEIQSDEDAPISVDGIDPGKIEDVVRKGKKPQP
ncbi:hypothetical protein [Shinella fusca]|uniref:Uncharacterized protein n=1 Tax=Shinella fusca TaxID=544480 RepID=A0A7W7YX87_9HYPH|nr:hypothetical protein [Shinella fusca]MBB5044033.1 hypothetical protein [Shinella fusca]